MRHDAYLHKVNWLYHPNHSGLPVSSWVRYHGLCPPESPKEQHARAHFPTDDWCIWLLAISCDFMRFRIRLPWFHDFQRLSAKFWSKYYLIWVWKLRIPAILIFDDQLRWIWMDLDGFGVYKSTIVYPDVTPSRWHFSAAQLPRINWPSVTATVRPQTRPLLQFCCLPHLATSQFHPPWWFHTWFHWWSQLMKLRGLFLGTSRVSRDMLLMLQ